MPAANINAARAISLHGSVRVGRGETGRTMMVSEQPRRVGGMSVEMVSFADPQERPVSILRGAGLHLPNLELFGPASVADLDRVAFAVDGAESREASYGWGRSGFRIDHVGASSP